MNETHRKPRRSDSISIPLEKSWEVAQPVSDILSLLKNEPEMKASRHSALTLPKANLLSNAPQPPGSSSFLSHEMGRGRADGGCSSKSWHGKTEYNVGRALSVVPGTQ